MSDISKSLDIVSLYEADEHLWAQEQISALTNNQLHRLDRKNLADYLAEMTQRDHRELRSRMGVLLVHLLKTLVQPDRYSRSWMMTITTQQKEIALLLEGVPSLRSKAPDYWDREYTGAVRQASRETKLRPDAFPSVNPWSFEDGLTFDPPELP